MSMMPNPMADMIEEAVGSAIEDRIRKVIKEELEPVIKLAATIDALIAVLSVQRGKFAKLLTEALSDEQPSG